MTLYNRLNKGQGQHEVAKVVVAKSSRLTAWQCFVHLLPISTSIAILWINFRGWYIGVDFPGLTSSDTVVLMLLQLSAKVHEIMIVASLSQIIWHAVRHELLYGEGLPLGLIGSALSFSSFEFYFKKEFYGSLGYLRYSFRRMKRLGFVVLLIISGMTAILAGPASAVLLVPRSQDYSAGGTHFYLNGSASDFWPDNLLDDMTELEEMCPGTESALRDVCPAGGFVSLWERWSSASHRDRLGSNVPSFANSLSGSRFYWPIHSPVSRIPPLFALGDPRSADESVQPYSWLVQAHAASAILLDQVTRDWWQAVPKFLSVVPSQVEDRNIRASVRSAIAAVRCTGLQDVSVQKSTMSFPSIEGRWNWAQDLSSDILFANNTPANFIRFQWVNLPDKFGAVSVGAVIELPRAERSNNRAVVGCAAQTGWVPTTLRTDAYTFWSGYYPYGIYFGERTPSWTAAGADQVVSPTNGRVALGEAWLNLLTPPAPPMPGITSNWSASTMEVILAAARVGGPDGTTGSTRQAETWAQEDQATNGAKTRLIETIISSVLVDGLSRSGSHRVFNQAGDMSDATLSMYQPRRDFGQRILQGRDALNLPDGGEATHTVLRASMLITGYAFRGNFPGYLAVTVLLAHAILASVHVLWLMLRKRVSRSWDSIAELVALAQNSQPAEKVLRNTGAGVGLFRTFATIAKIRVRPVAGKAQQDRVELVFEEDLGQEQRSSSSDETNSSMQLERAQGAPVNVSDRQDCIPASWTFPIDRTKVRISHQIHAHSHNDSTENLIPQTRKDAKASDLVRVEYVYG